MRSQCRHRGSSPRMRGAHIEEVGFSLRAGIIPADAGSTSVTPSVMLGALDHPRGCGEHRLSECDFCLRWGSSPRMRGALDPSSQQHQPGRIIPADAGSTAAFRIRSAAMGDHPRGCGEHIANVLKKNDISGSSPRMRGALRLAFRQLRVLGIIPADAGSTKTKQLNQRPSEDHPRGCGEHYNDNHPHAL